MREGTRVFIERHSSWEVCGAVFNGREAVAHAIQSKPDIVIMDMSMPELNGLDAAIQIKRRLPATEIVMFTAHETDDLVRDAFEAGVKSFIQKSEAADLYVQAIESLARHELVSIPHVSTIPFPKILSQPKTSATQNPGSA